MAERNMQSFEADEDVNRMLERAAERGYKKVFICNEALRKWLTQQGFARKKDLLVDAEKKSA